MSNPLEDATNAGLSVIRELLETGAEFDSTPLEKAARAEANLVDLLLADEPLIVAAARRGEVAVVKYLIAKHPGHVRSHGEQALRAAREHGRSLCAALLEDFLESE
jgi:hypothetical protein